MDGAHDTALDRRVIIEGLRHRGEAVGGAGSGGDHGVLGLQDVLIDIVNDGREVITCRSRNDNLLGAGLDMGGSLLLGGVETGALEHDVNAELAPRALSGVLDRVDLDFLAFDNDGIQMCIRDSLSAGMFKRYPSSSRQQPAAVCTRTERIILCIELYTYAALT